MKTKILLLLIITAITFSCNSLKTKKTSNTIETATPAPISQRPYKIGFGYVLNTLLSKNEAEIINFKINGFEENHGIELAFESLSKSDLEHYNNENMENNASRIVWNFEERKKNNIVVLFDYKNNVWLFFGSENGSYMQRHQSKLESTFKKDLKKKKTAEAINNLIDNLEVIIENNTN